MCFLVQNEFPPFFFLGENFILCYPYYKTFILKGNFEKCPSNGTTLNSYPDVNDIRIFAPQLKNSMVNAMYIDQIIPNKSKK